MIALRDAVNVIRTKLAHMRRLGDETRFLMCQIDKKGIHGVDAVTLSTLRDQLRETADELDAMIGVEDLKKAA